MSSTFTKQSTPTRNKWVELLAAERIRELLPDIVVSWERQCSWILAGSFDSSGAAYLTIRLDLQTNSRKKRVLLLPRMVSSLPIDLR